MEKEKKAEYISDNLKTKCEVLLTPEARKEIFKAVGLSKSMVDMVAGQTAKNYDITNLIKYHVKKREGEMQEIIDLEV